MDLGFYVDDAFAQHSEICGERSIQDDQAGPEGDSYIGIHILESYGTSWMDHWKIADYLLADWI